MASAQAQLPASAQDDKNKTALNEMLKEAQNMISKTANNRISDKVIVGGAMMNSHEYAIRLYKTHSWAGEFAIEPNYEMVRGKPALFVHEGQQSPSPPIIPPPMARYGSKGAVLYGNFVLENGQAQPNNVGPVCGWILAWSVLDNDHHVYVSSGLLGDMMKLTWDEVKEKLDKSGTSSKYFDPKTGAEASAIITPDGNVAALGSIFGRQNVLHSN